MQVLNYELYKAKTLEKSNTDFSSISFVKPLNTHAHAIQTITTQLPGSLNIEKISMWLDYFLIENENNVLRVKGILNIDGMERKVIVQSVGQGFHVTHGNKWNDDEYADSKIVIIGTNLNEQDIKLGLRKLIQTHTV